MLLLKGDSRFFLSSPPHLLDVPVSLPRKVARGRNVVFSVLDTGKISLALGILSYKGWG